MTTTCTIYNASGLITSVSELSDETFEMYVNTGVLALLDVVGNPNTQYVLNNELVNYTPAELEAKNNMPPGWIWQLPERIAVDQRALEVERAKRIDRVNAERDVRIAAFDRFTYNGNLFDGNTAAQSNIDAAARGARLNLPLPDGFAWRLFDNTDVPFTNADILGMEAAFLTASNLHRYIQHGMARIIKQQLQEATSLTQLDAVTWDSVAIA